MDWYYVVDSGKQGPISEKELEGKFAAGALPRSTLVWRNGMREWQPANQVPEFSPVKSPPLQEPPLLTEARLADPMLPTTLPTQAPAGVTAKTISPFAITSMVLGILGIVMVACLTFASGVFSLPAVIFGHLAIKQIRESEGRLEGNAMAITGLITGYIGLAICVISVAVVAFIILAGATIETS